MKPDNSQPERYRTARIVMQTFPSFKQALDSYWRAKGFKNMTDLALGLIADKIGWKGPF